MAFTLITQENRIMFKHSNNFRLFKDKTKLLWLKNMKCHLGCFKELCLQAGQVDLHPGLWVYLFRNQCDSYQVRWIVTLLYPVNVFQKVLISDIQTLAMHWPQFEHTKILKWMSTNRCFYLFAYVELTTICLGTPRPTLVWKIFAQKNTHGRNDNSDKLGWLFFRDRALPWMGQLRSRKKCVKCVFSK